MLLRITKRTNIEKRVCFVWQRYFCQKIAAAKGVEITIAGKTYRTDEWTNVTPKIVSHVGRRLYDLPNHPLGLVTKRITNFFYRRFRNSRGNPTFSVHKILSPVVSIGQNFDDLLIPANHPSRLKSDTYYVNQAHVLRSQTSAHQKEMIRAGLDEFLFVGDVYRNEDIDNCHYPVFHQVEGVRLKDESQVFDDKEKCKGLKIFERNGIRTSYKQEIHTLESVKLMEHELKSCLVDLAKDLFGKNMQYRWSESFFPFTHPSFELEINFDGDWMEMLGCGIMEHKLLENAGAGHKIGWAFGAGLERLAMKAYEIPDIRLFWTEDTGFLNQFKTNDPNKIIKYQPISRFPQCPKDLSFWISDKFDSDEFFRLVKRFGGDIVEQVELIDQFEHPKSGKRSQCYRIVYRHMYKTLVNEEVNRVHRDIAQAAVKQFDIVLR